MEDFTISQRLYGLLKDRLADFRKGDLYVFAGRPGMGKTTVLLNLLQAMMNQDRVLYLQTEKNYGDEKLLAVSAQNNLPVTCKIYMDLHELKTILRETSYDYIFIDCFQTMDRTEPADYAKELKKMALIFNVGIFVSSALSRRTDRRRNHHPRKRDMTKCMCDSLWKYADEIIFLYRQQYYDKKAINNSIELHFAKRNERCGINFDMLSQIWEKGT